MADVQVGFSESTGKHFVKLPGNLVQEVTPEQAAQIQENPGFVSNLIGSAGEMAKNTLLGAGSLMGDGWSKQELLRSNQELAARNMQSPVSTLAGQAAPALAVGAATMGAGIVPTVAAEALLGAAQSPEAPLTGAALGGAFGAVPFAGPLVRQGVRAASDMAGNLPIGQTLGVVGPRSMAERVAQRIGATSEDFMGPPAPRVMRGDLTSQWFDEAQIPITPAQRAMLNATSSEEAAVAKRMKWVEDIRGTGPEELAAQRMGFTNLVKRELGIEGVEALRPSVVSDVLKREGSIIGELTQAGGPVKFEAADTLRAIVKDADTTHKGALGNVVKDIEASMTRNAGHIDPQDMQNAMTRLRDMSGPGQSFGKAQDAGKVLDELEKALEKRLTTADKAALREARYRYKIAKTLDRTGSIGNDGNINPRSFGGAWDKKIGQTLRGKDTIGQAADTFDALSRMEANTGSTLQRVFANAPGYAGKTAPGAIGAAVGVPAAAGLFSGLLGN